MKKSSEKYSGYVLTQVTNEKHFQYTLTHFQMHLKIDHTVKVNSTL